jgi:hypothetical protein
MQPVVIGRVYQQGVKQTVEPGKICTTRRRGAGPVWSVVMLKFLRSHGGCELVGANMGLPGEDAVIVHASPM